MYFWLQCEGDKSDIELEVRILRDMLRQEQYLHQYCYRKNTDITPDEEKLCRDHIIPVGDLDYVAAFLKTYYDVDHMNPIEVPDILRTDDFLKRKYSIRPKAELPKSGRYFTKYVSELKVFSHIGEISTLHYEDNNQDPFLKDGFYQVSEVIDIRSEQRFFI